MAKSVTAAEECKDRWTQLVVPSKVLDGWTWRLGHFKHRQSAMVVQIVMKQMRSIRNRFPFFMSLTFLDQARVKFLGSYIFLILWPENIFYFFQAFSILRDMRRATPIIRKLIFSSFYVTADTEKNKTSRSNDKKKTVHTSSYYTTL